ncbi:hypothetical protein [Nostoc sp. CHAB 5715]|uniref:hypothetical protein n=1 Tax=Nostoc sp. CHAB 5715 TaxID=2780400 RepID=UPI001E4E9D27|nr:hypothetical protein [Nostoc sp. CHAB 5715]MCC5620958.1 hypothetical protein [Nostoc sp. CHAB 5715]
MTKHDTWVKLKPGNPYEPILDLFPDGMIPMRDPFALERVTTDNGDVLALWIVDMERLSSFQYQALSQIIAIHRNTDPLEVATEATLKGGFAINSEWVESIKCWVEGFERGRELADFLETAPPQGTSEGKRAFWEFYSHQHERWIEGNQEPRPINSIEDIHPSLRTDELERLIKMHQVESAIAAGNYSVLDVLTGQAMVDALNIIDPENTYSLVGDDDEFEDDEIYE